ncbi:hypothetical protein HF888_01825 [Bermanella marisrubri]|uniref:Sugar fermentation stimulation protein A n=1 Tax=Bermanella marisrubri TaxID=207949 RepID=Q1N103_9GAMM|nr:hypothetical protein [Bermanella marisrubri]EAT11871.1 sugar fermentation stimulation protein A [Oceanobacter sp. RED65] [Bermanella marisrubri]QIZ83050.1 hypothetical protein HF888_01825 [Bermanella marisrubri]
MTARYMVRCLILILFMPLSFTVSAQCDRLFNRLMSAEPYLKDALQDLKKTCVNEIAKEDNRYWQCIDKRIDDSNASFEQFMLSSEVCDLENTQVGQY